jgi:predicted aldo/keto reductase-like oxidoreductase
MQYRKLGKTGLSVSALGFGAMRLPMQGEAVSSADRFNPLRKVDEDTALKMFEYAVSRGINYFDTAYLYHNGQSEVITGKGLKRHRDKVIIATKLPTMIIQRTDDFNRILEEQLEKLGTSYLDVYLAHGLNRSLWNRMKEMGMLGFFEQIKADGRVRHVGFSFHDDVRVFKEIVNGYDWEIAQIQYNYFDENSQAGNEGLTYASSKGLGIVIMEPVRGGKLADPVPGKVKMIWASADIKRTPAQWALRWVWNHPEVSVVLSGMSTMDQMIENVETAEEALPDTLSSKELSLIQRANDVYRSMMKVDCTGCGYCMPCPSGVSIPTALALYNDYHVFQNDRDSSVTIYNRMLSSDEQASACTECGECEEKCPQQIEIREKLREAHAVLYNEDIKSLH